MTNNPAVERAIIKSETDSTTDEKLTPESFSHGIVPQLKTYWVTVTYRSHRAGLPWQMIMWHKKWRGTSTYCNIPQAEQPPAAHKDLYPPAALQKEISYDDNSKLSQNQWEAN